MVFPAGGLHTLLSPNLYFELELKNNQTSPPEKQEEKKEEIKGIPPQSLPLTRLAVLGLFSQWTVGKQTHT